MQSEHHSRLAKPVVSCGGARSAGYGRVATAAAAIAAVVLTVHPSVPARTPQELLALSERLKGGLNYGSNGTGTTSHLAGVMSAQIKPD